MPGDERRGPVVLVLKLSAGSPESDALDPELRAAALPEVPWSERCRHDSRVAAPGPGLTAALRRGIAVDTPPGRT